MKVNLLYPNKDFKIQEKFSNHQENLVIDLELEYILNCAAKKNPHYYSVMKTVLLNDDSSEEVINYRQEIFTDFVNNTELMIRINKLVTDAMIALRTSYFGINESSINSKYFSSAGLTYFLLPVLKTLNELLLSEKPNFCSAGLLDFVDQFNNELSIEKLNHLIFTFEHLQFRPGVLVRGHINTSNILDDFHLMQYEESPDNDRKWRRAKKFEVNFLDDGSHREYLRKLDLSLNPIVDSVAKVCESLYTFFHSVYDEFAFYLAAINIRNAFISRGIVFSLPKIVAKEKHVFKVTDLIELGLALNDKAVVGNTISTENDEAILITGANQGGKSTFLRSAGEAILLANAGIMVPAKEFTISHVPTLYTHFGREEDDSMQSGRLDEELSRMSEIINDIKPYSLVLFNESFVSTNEREGALIASGIIDALTDEKIWVFFVTHMFELYHKVESSGKKVFYLRASRERDYRLVNEKPLITSYAIDLYNHIFKE